jgi:hypothetical protein
MFPSALTPFNEVVQLDRKVGWALVFGGSVVAVCGTGLAVYATIAEGLSPLHIGSGASIATGLSLLRLAYSRFENAAVLASLIKRRTELADSKASKQVAEIDKILTDMCRFRLLKGTLDVRSITRKQ